MTSQKWIKWRLNHDPDLHVMILLSAAIHTAILSMIFLLPSLPSPKFTFGPVYSVQLVSSSDALISRTDTPAVSGEFSRRADRSSILKKEADTNTSLPVKKTDIQRQDFSGVEKAMDSIRQKVSSTGSSAIVAQKHPGDSEINRKMNQYYARIWARIKNQWILPQSILQRGNIEAVVHARILRSGAVTELSFEKRSGNRYFDESVMRAVRKAHPLPPLPEWIRDGSIEIGIRFHSSDLR
jgi:TonB family protein